MTAASPTGKRYARALFDLAAESSQQPAVAAAVASLAAAVKTSDVSKALANPRLTPAQRAKLAETMATAVKAPKPLANTLGLLAANNRLAVVTQVFDAYQEIHDTATGVTHVQLQSAVPLSEAQKATLAAAVKAHTKASDVRLDETVDASLLGGFKAYFNGLVWDASVSGNLARLTTRLRTAIAQRQH